MLIAYPSTTPTPGDPRLRRAWYALWADAGHVPRAPSSTTKRLFGASIQNPSDSAFLHNPWKILNDSEVRRTVRRTAWSWAATGIITVERPYGLGTSAKLRMRLEGLLRRGPGVPTKPA